MTLTLSPAETARKVADIIDYENERFSIQRWELQTGCGTTACIAGHTALLHQDGLDANKRFVFTTEKSNGTRELELKPGSAWMDRQASRLGLTSKAGRFLFSPAALWDYFTPDLGSLRYSLVLRQMVKELEHRDPNDMIDIPELKQIAEKALA